MTVSRAATPRNSGPERAVLAKIHIAKKELGLDDEAYRDVLKRVTGKRSSRDLNDYQLDQLFREFKRLGWKPKKTRRRVVRAQVRMIYALWGVLHEGGAVENGGPEACEAWVRRMYGADLTPWMAAEECNDVIESLKQWIYRAGLEDKLI